MSTNDRLIVIANYMEEMCPRDYNTRYEPLIEAWLKFRDDPQTRRLHLTKLIIAEAICWHSITDAFNELSNAIKDLNP